MTGRYKMSTMVRLTGFSPALLRAWERRHRILQPARGPGGHRLYTDEDLAVLRYVQRLLAQGRSIGEIATSGRDELLEAAQKFLGSEPPPRAGSAPAAREPTGGAQLAPLCAGVVEAAVAMDAERIERLLDQAFAAVSADLVIHRVIEPAALEIGELWVRGRCTVASEHLASGCFVHRLRKLIESASLRDPAAPRAIFCCFPDENHELGLLILAYHFSRNGWRISYLGPLLPFEDLERACDVLKPRAVVLSVTRQSLYLTHKPRLIELLNRHRDRLTFFIGGQGAPEEDPELTAAGGEFCPNGRPAPERVLDLLGRTTKRSG